MDPNRPVGFESRKRYAARCASGFWDRYASGRVVVDIGYRGGIPDALPIVDGAYGIEPGLTPRYDGLYLPFSEQSVDTIHASHVLEHVKPAIDYLQEWYRVLRYGGFMILMVPHAYLYERKMSVPSMWSPEHLTVYTPGLLMMLIEAALAPNSYRVRHLEDEDAGYDYSLPRNVHPVGCLEICLVLEKIRSPEWKVEP